MNTDIQKKMSASDLEVECDPRYLGERFMGQAIESEPQRYGIEVHEIARKCNVWRRERREEQDPNVEPPIEKVREWVLESKVQRGDLGKAERAITWFLEKTYGTDPLNMERLTDVEVGGYLCVIKPDCVRIGGEGALVIDDYKTGWVPSADIVRRSMRQLFYAVACRQYYGLPTVKTVIWNFTEEYSIVIEWTDEELNSFEPYVWKALEQRAEVIKVIEATPKEELGKLFDDPRFEPRQNGFCDSCGRRKLCPKYINLVLYGVFPIGTTDPERLEMARMAARTINKAVDAIGNGLKSDVLEQGVRGTKTTGSGKEIPTITLRQGDWETVIEVHESQLNNTELKDLRGDILFKGKKTVEDTRGKKMIQYTVDFGDGVKASIRKGEEGMAELWEGYDAKRQTRLSRKLFVRRAES